MAGVDETRDLQYLSADDVGIAFWRPLLSVKRSLYIIIFWNRAVYDLQCPRYVFRGDWRGFCGKRFLMVLLGRRSYWSPNLITGSSLSNANWSRNILQLWNVALEVRLPSKSVYFPLCWAFARLTLVGCQKTPSAQRSRSMKWMGLLWKRLCTMFDMRIWRQTLAVTRIGIWRLSSMLSCCTKLSWCVTLPSMTFWSLISRSSLNMGTVIWTSVSGSLEGRIQTWSRSHTYTKAFLQLQNNGGSRWT